MKKFIIAVSCSLFISSSYAESNEQINKAAETAVKSELSKNYKQGECQKWLLMADNGNVSKKRAIANCDNDFNVDKGLTFSEVKIYRHEDKNAVCGIVSGFTDISRIGSRFVYTDGEYGHVTIKNSKYPTFHLSDDQLSKNMITLINNQYKNESNLYCK